MMSRDLSGDRTLPGNVDADRRELAAYLRRHGPMTGPAIRAALGWDTARFWVAVASAEWFAMTADGWVLTFRAQDRGGGARAAVARSD
jgi:hypothetical protein